MSLIVRRQRSPYTVMVRLTGKPGSTFMPDLIPESENCARSAGRNVQGMTQKHKRNPHGVLRISTVSRCTSATGRTGSNAGNMAYLQSISPGQTAPAGSRKTSIMRSPGWPAGCRRHASASLKRSTGALWATASGQPIPVWSRTFQTGCTACAGSAWMRPAIGKGMLISRSCMTWTATGQYGSTRATALRPSGFSVKSCHCRNVQGSRSLPATAPNGSTGVWNSTSRMPPAVSISSMSLNGRMKNSISSGLPQPARQSANTSTEGNSSGRRRSGKRRPVTPCGGRSSA